MLSPWVFRSATAAGSMAITRAGGDRRRTGYGRSAAEDARPAALLPREDARLRGPRATCRVGWRAQGKKVDGLALRLRRSRRSRPSARDHAKRGRAVRGSADTPHGERVAPTPGPTTSAVRRRAGCRPSWRSDRTLVRSPFNGRHPLRLGTPSARLIEQPGSASAVAHSCVQTISRSRACVTQPTLERNGGGPFAELVARGLRSLTVCTGLEPGSWGRHHPHPGRHGRAERAHPPQHVEPDAVRQPDGSETRP